MIPQSQLDMLFHSVEVAIGISREDIVSPIRRRSFVEGRQIISSVLRVRDCTLQEIGNVINRDYSSVIALLKAHKYDTEHCEHYRDVYRRAMGIFTGKERLAECGIEQEFPKRQLPNQSNIR